MDVKRELIRDHEDHANLLEQLADAVEAKRDAEHLRKCWVTFEENLLDHLVTEERFLFTTTVQAHRLEIEQLRVEHRLIRQTVVGIGALLEAGVLEKRAIDELRTLLAAHGEHEERSLHRWLEIDEGILAHRGVMAIRNRRERSATRLRDHDESTD
ncbi:MAG TPA: hemerythrin domain-containing protein [Polyangiaceae bacterium]|nr:hemerythrin domain-containing protein [Polyangiaceae bacterium]